MDDRKTTVNGLIVHGLLCGRGGAGRVTARADGGVRAAGGGVV
jgi:hypothetical protein